MDAENALKPEIFKSIVVTLVPGLMALAPFIFVAEHFCPSLFDQLEKHQVLCISIVVAVIIAIGYILEDFGSRLEVIFWWFIATEDDDTNWYKYLATPISNSPTESYIQSIVIRMKFESSFAIACFIFALGYLWLSCLNIVSRPAYWYGTLGLCVLALYLLFESYSGVCLLKKLRSKLAV